MTKSSSAILTLLFTSVISISSIAQDKPTAEVTGSYQFDRLTSSIAGNSASINVPLGWDASVNVPLLPWLGVVGDVGGIRKSESSFFNFAGTSVSISGTAALYTFGGGPQITYRKGSIHPFARFLLGDAHSTASTSANVSGSSFSGSASTDSFFIAPGGGADFRITHNIWLRGGADYFRTGKYGVTVNGVRAFAGVTFTFGGNRASSNPARSDPAASNPGQPEQSPQPLRAMDSTKINVGVLGLTVVTAESAGAKVAEVTPNSPAAKAGLHSGDVINSVDGAPIKTPSDLTTQLAVRSSQEKIRIGYLVHGQWQTEVVVFLSD